MSSSNYVPTYMYQFIVITFPGGVFSFGTLLYICIARNGNVYFLAPIGSIGGFSVSLCSLLARQMEMEMNRSKSYCFFVCFL